MNDLPAPLWVILTSNSYAVRLAFDDGNQNVLNFHVFAAGSALHSDEELWGLDDNGDTHSLSDWQKVPWELHGFLKWDGCINWQTNPDCMMHGCGPNHVDDLTAIFQTVYCIGKRHMSLLNEAVKPLPEGAVELPQ